MENATFDLLITCNMLFIFLLILILLGKIRIGLCVCSICGRKINLGEKIYWDDAEDNCCYTCAKNINDRAGISTN